MSQVHKVFGRKQEGNYYERPGSLSLSPSTGTGLLWSIPSEGFFCWEEESRGRKMIWNVSGENVWRNVGIHAGFGEMLASAEAYSIHDKKGLFHPIQHYYPGELIEKVQEPTEKDHSLFWMTYEQIKGNMFSDMQNWAVELAWKERK